MKLSQLFLILTAITLCHSSLWANEDNVIITEQRYTSTLKADFSEARLVLTKI